MVLNGGIKDRGRRERAKEVPGEPKNTTQKVDSNRFTTPQL